MPNMDDWLYVYELDNAPDIWGDLLKLHPDTQAPHGLKKLYTGSHSIVISEGEDKDKVKKLAMQSH